MYKTLKILLAFILIMIGNSSFAQVVNLQLSKGVTTWYELHNVMYLDNVNYEDFAVTKNEYFIKVFFGQKQFDVKVYESNTGLLHSADFLLFGQNDFFSKQETDNNSEKYRMIKSGIDYVVAFNEILPSFRTGQKTVGVFISVRDTLKKKYLYLASDIIYIKP